MANRPTLVTEGDRMNTVSRRLGGRELRPLPEDARAAIEALRAAGWRQSGLSTVCSCGASYGGRWTLICRKCADCCPHRMVRGYVVKADGICTPRRFCGHCGRRGSDPPKGEWIYDVCFEDTREQRPVLPCARCGGTDGTQMHHWAPWAIFADAEAWPQAALCQPCHSAWHAGMQAAAGVSLPPDRRAASPHARPDDFGIEPLLRKTEAWSASPENVS